MSAEQIFTRRRLPHWYVPGAAHFLTYRLADTIPHHVLGSWRRQFDHFCDRAAKEGTPNYRTLAHKMFFAKYDRYLGAHRGDAHLSVPAVAAVIRGNLYHHDGGLYHLIAYCVMPNHVHVVLQPICPVAKAGEDEVAGERPDAGSPLVRITHSLKSYTANRANEVLGRTGRFWQGESYDHWVRDDDELERIVAYVANNPVAAGLATRAVDWHFSSAQDRFLIDGDEGGWFTAPWPAEEVVLPARR
jgi:putative DNA methylase